MSSRASSSTTLQVVPRVLLNQLAPDVQAIGQQHGFADPAGMCGFLSLAIVACLDRRTTTDVCANDERDKILVELEQRVLPNFARMRREYEERHSTEFCNEGVSWQESGGRMSRSSFRHMMAGTAEIQQYLRCCFQKNPARSVDGENDDDDNGVSSAAAASLNVSRSNSNSPVYLLRPILEGPAVNENSIRFPPPCEDSPGVFVMELDRLFVQEERQFYNTKKNDDESAAAAAAAAAAQDYYIGDESDRCYSLAEWGSLVREYLREKGSTTDDNEQKCVWIILDLHGHYCTAKICRDSPSDGCSENTCLLTCILYDTMENKEISKSPAVLALSSAVTNSDSGENESIAANPPPQRK